MNKKSKILAEKYGYLPYMIERYLDFLGEDQTIEYLNANETPLKTVIRCNTLKKQPLELQKSLSHKGFSLSSIDWIPYAFEVKNEPLNIGSLHEFLQGYYYIQNLASMLPAHVLKPDGKELIMDMCAAPGSKSTQLAQLMENEGKLILIEKNKSRIPSLKVNLRRMGVVNSVILEMDAANLNNLKINANKILLDAPCTGEGLVREDKTRKTSKSFKDIEKMARIQKKLLIAGLNSLDSKGLILYSTCSIAPEENELVINDVLDNMSKFRILKIPRQYGSEGLIEYQGKALNPDLRHAQRFYPHIHDTIGFFICLIEKIG